MTVSRLRLPLVAVLALMVQTAVLYRFRVAGVVPNALLLVAVCAGLTAGPATGAVAGFLCGLLADLVLLTTPEGLSALVFSVVAYAVGVVNEGTVGATWWMPVLGASAASAAGEVLWALAAAVVGHPDLVEPRLIVVAALVALWHAVLAPVFLRVTAWSVGATPAGAAPAEVAPWR